MSIGIAVGCRRPRSLDDQDRIDGARVGGNDPKARDLDRDGTAPSIPTSGADVGGILPAQKNHVGYLPQRSDFDLMESALGNLAVTIASRRASSPPFVLLRFLLDREVS